MPARYPRARSPEPGAIIGRETIDLRLRELRGDDAHPSIHVIAPLAGCVQPQLPNEVLVSLLSQDRRLDWPP